MKQSRTHLLYDRTNILMAQATVKSVVQIGGLVGQVLEMDSEK